MLRVTGSRKVRLPAATRDSLAQVVADPMAGAAPCSFRAVNAVEGVTFTGMPLRLLHLQHNYRRNPTGYDVFAAIHPATGEPLAGLAVYSDFDSRRAEMMHGFSSVSTDFSVPEGHRGKGIGAAITAHAIDFAVRNNHSITSGTFNNPAWRDFHAKLGFSIQRGAGGVHYAFVPLARLQHFASRRGPNGYSYYLLKKEA